MTELPSLKEQSFLIRMIGLQQEAVWNGGRMFRQLTGSSTSVCQLHTSLSTLALVPETTWRKANIA